MVAAGGDDHAVADGDLVVFGHHGLLGDGADAEDERLRGIDDGEKAVDAVAAEAGERDRAALVFLGLEFFASGFGREFFHLHADFAERESVGFFDDRSNKAVLDGHGDGEVDVGVFDDGVAIVGGVDLWHFGCGAGGGEKDKVVDGEFLGTVLFGHGIEFLAQGHERSAIHRDAEVEVRNLGFAGEEALGDGFAHAGERDGFFFAGDAVGGADGGCGGNSGSPTPDGCGFDILFDDASGGAGAGDG